MMPLPAFRSQACTRPPAISRYCSTPLELVGPTEPTGSAWERGVPPSAKMVFASRPSNWPNHEPAAGAEVKNPTFEVPPGQVLARLLPAHQTCTGGATTGQVPVGREPVQLFCAKEATLLKASIIGNIRYILAFISKSPRSLNNFTSHNSSRGRMPFLTQVLCHLYAPQRHTVTRTINNLGIVGVVHRDSDVSPFATYTPDAFFR